MSRHALPWILLALTVTAVAVTALAGTKPTAHYLGEPVFTADGRLQPPTGYNHWVFLTSDLGMSYNEDASDPSHPPFSNVFADPTAYRSFMRTGTWPEHTQLIKEFRASATKGSINQHGFFQTGAPPSVLVHVKDSKRFKGGWGFFMFSGSKPTPATMIPTTASCYSCHRAHGAVDTTFVQFYPDQLPIATKKGTLSKGYLNDQAHDHSGTH